MSAEVEIARTIARTRRQVDDQARGSQAAFRSVEVNGPSGVYRFYDESGNVIAESKIEPSTGTIVTAHNKDAVKAPPRPSVPIVRSAVGAIEIVWDGTFDDGVWSEAIYGVEVHEVVDADDINTGNNTQVSIFTSSKGGVYSFPSTYDDGVRFFRFQTVAISGLESDVSDPASGRAGAVPSQDEIDAANAASAAAAAAAASAAAAAAAAQSTANDANTTAGAAAGAVSGATSAASAASAAAAAAAAAITAWTYTGTTSIDGGKIRTDTVDAGAIKSDTYTGKVVTGATLQTADPGSGSVKNEAVVIRNDGTGGIIESYSGFAGETPGSFNPTSRRPRRVPSGAVKPALQIRPSKSTTYYRRPTINLIADNVIETGSDDDFGGFMDVGVDSLAVEAVAGISMVAGDLSSLVLDGEGSGSVGPLSWDVDGNASIDLNAGRLKITDTKRAGQFNLTDRIDRTDWQVPTYAAGWREWDIDTDKEPCRFRLVNGDSIELIGAVRRTGTATGVTSANPVFVLPSWAIPLKTVRRPGFIHATSAATMWTIGGSNTTVPADAGKVWIGTSIAAGGGGIFGFTYPLGI